MFTTYDDMMTFQKHFKVVFLHLGIRQALYYEFSNGGANLLFGRFSRKLHENEAKIEPGALHAFPLNPTLQKCVLKIYSETYPDEAKF